MTLLFQPTRRRFLATTGAAVGALTLGAGRPARAVTAAQHGGTATLLISSQPPVITTIAHTAFNSVYVSPKTTEGLLDYDFDLTPRPALATEWDISSDGLEYTFTLRPGVKWHDGAPFTAEDAAFSIAAVKEVHPRGRNTFANLADVQVLDPLTVRLRLAKPAPYLLTALAASETPIVPKHLYEGSNPAENPVNNAPVGTGPFKFKEWVRGSHIVYERNPDYWNAPKPYLDRLVVRFVPDISARSIAIETGEIDIAPSTPVPLNELERFATLPHLEIVKDGYQYANGISRVDFNLEKPYFQDVRVRRAFAHVIDRNVIRDVVQYGVGETINGPISKNLTRWYVPDLPTYANDPAEAERLLDAAGLPRDPDGVRLRITHDYVPSGESYKRGAEYIRQALAAVGVEATVRSQDFATYTKRKYTDRDFDFTFNGMSNLFDPTVGVQRLYWSKNFKPGVPFSNGMRYSNSRVDELLETAAVTVDYDARYELFAEFQRILVEDVPDFGVTSSSDLTIVNRRVAGHTTGAAGAAGSFADLNIVA
jgi:peptide/nickel transport system substrate-binding protein